MEAQSSKLLARTIQVAHWEGISFLVLLCIAMPMKYFMNQPLAVTIVGGVHGVLFIAFIWQVYAMFDNKIWTVKKCAYAMLLSILPAGTFFLK